MAKDAVSGSFATRKNICDRCQGKISFYADETKEHELWLCWKCGKFNGVTHVNDEFNDMILVNPPLILELLEDKTLIPMEPIDV